jgi:hypothetical protein
MIDGSRLSPFGNSAAIACSFHARMRLSSLIYTGAVILSLAAVALGVVV